MRGEICCSETNHCLEKTMTAKPVLGEVAPDRKLTAPEAAIERQARMLCQRFALAPEVARTVARLAFASEARP
jgi:hypothetical protein